MNISEFIKLVTPDIEESARNRELSASKFNDNKVVSAVAFLIKSAQQGDVGALSAVSTLLFKESEGCIYTQAMAAEYAKEVLKKASTNKVVNKLAKKVINALSKDSHDKQSRANLLKNNENFQVCRDEQYNVLALSKVEPIVETKIAEIKLGDKPKVG